jgi:hypothetical protein
MTAATHRRLWLTAGWLLIGYVALTFAGVGFEHSLMLGDSASKASAALVHSSMSRNFTGGYLEYLGTLVFLVAGLLVARLLRADGVVGDWLSSCMSAGVVALVAVDASVGFAAGAAALYDGHHGASLATVTTVNDIRNFAYFLSAGLQGVFALAAAAAVASSGRLPRWVAYSGAVVGVLSIATIPAARTGLIDVATMLGFAWLLGLGIASLRQAGRTDGVTAPTAAAATV